MTHAHTNRRWWLAARNSPLVAGGLNLVLAAAVVLSIQWGKPHYGEPLAVAFQLSIGVVMCVPARFAPRPWARGWAVVVGAVPSWLMGFAAATMGNGWTLALGVLLLGVWGLAFYSVLFLGVGWTKEAVARAGCCVNCGYDRKGLDAAALCPECGAGAGPPGG